MTQARATRSGRIRTSRDIARQTHTLRSWTRSGTPTPPAPASARPSSPAATSSSQAFDVVLERVARGRPERSIVLTGLRGVGKTVLLNALRSAAVRAALGHRQARGPPRPVAAPPAVGRAAPGGARARPPAGRRRRPRARRGQGVRPARRRPARRQAARPVEARASTCRPSRGRADSGDIEIDLVELLTDVGGLAADVGTGIAIFIDEMQDLGPDDVSALCAACHEISQSGLPRRSSSAPDCRTCRRCCRRRSPTPSGCSATQRIDRLDRDRRRPRAARAGRATRAPSSADEALAAMYAATGGYPYFVQAYGKVALGPRAALADHGRDVAVAAPEAESRAGRRVLRLALRAGDARPSASTCARWPTPPSPSGRRTRPVVPTADVADRARPQAAVAVAGAGRAAQEGADLLRRARPDRVHRPALRPVPPRPGVSVSGSRRAWRCRRPRRR